MYSQFWSALIVGGCVLISLTSVVDSSPFQRHAVYRRGQRLCGKALAEAVKFVCNSSYATPPSSASSEGKRYLLSYDYRVPVWNSYGFTDSREASSMLSSRSIEERKRQIANECCRKSCGYYTLLSYCSSDQQAQVSVEELVRSIMK